MNWYSIMGFVSTLALFLPILLILVLQMGSYKSFPILLFYYASVFIYALMKENYVHVSNDLLYVWGISNNLLDTPLILLFLTYFSPTRVFNRRLKGLILLFILFEAVVIWLNGFTLGALTIILGPGILVVFSLCLYFFIRQSKIVIINRKAMGKTLITASLVFSYGCYGILYMLFYVFETRLVEDAFLIYFLVVTFASGILCTGILFERKRIQKLLELKKARKELHAIYKDVKTAGSFRTAMLDFDRDAWN